MASLYYGYSSKLHKNMSKIIESKIIKFQLTEYLEPVQSNKGKLVGGGGGGRGGGFLACQYIFKKFLVYTFSDDVCPKFEKLAVY